MIPLLIYMTRGVFMPYLKWPYEKFYCCYHLSAKLNLSLRKHTKQNNIFCVVMTNHFEPSYFCQNLEVLLLMHYFLNYFLDLRGLLVLHYFLDLGRLLVMQCAAHADAGASDGWWSYMQATHDL